MKSIKIKLSHKMLKKINNKRMNKIKMKRFQNKVSYFLKLF